MSSENGWHEKRVRDLCELGRGRVISTQELEQHPGIYPVYSSQSYNKGQMGTIDSYDFDGEYVTWTTDGAYAGTVFYRTGKFNCTNVCGTLRARDTTDMQFLAYKLGTVAKQHVSYVGNPKLMNGVVADIRLKLPTRAEEQSKIAEILSTVDRAIERTEALIAKQQRIKTGLMQDLLTRGIDEQGNLRSEETHQFKDSPLGRIPVEWDYTTVGNELLGIDAGKSPDCPDRPAGAGEWGVLKVSAVQPDGFLPHENKVIPRPTLANPAYEVHDGDLLISRSNTYQLVGIVCLVRSPPERLMLCDKTLRLRFKPSRTNTEFMFWILQQPLVRRQIELNATGTSGSMKNISQPVIRELKIVLPDPKEQERIANRIDEIQSSITVYTKFMRKLRSLKTALMQDLLTGEKRVTPLLEPAVTT